MCFEYPNFKIVFELQYVNLNLSRSKKDGQADCFLPTHLRWEWRLPEIGSAPRTRTGLFSENVIDYS